MLRGHPLHGAALDVPAGTRQGVGTTRQNLLAPAMHCAGQPVDSNSRKVHQEQINAALDYRRPSRAHSSPEKRFSGLLRSRKGKTGALRTPMALISRRRWLLSPSSSRPRV